MSRLIRLASALLLACTPLAPAFAEAPAATGAKGLTVSVTHPQRRDLSETLLVTGSLVPREEIQVGPEIEGYRLMQIFAEVGDKVEKGQVLARLSRDMLDVQLAQNVANAAKARAAIAQQRATLDQMLAQEAEATSAVERSRQLRKTGVASQEVLDERERAVKVASAQVAAAREALVAAEADATLVAAQRDEIELRLKRTDIRAPEAGTVLTRDARIGSIVLSTRSEPLFRIAADGAIDLDAEVPEASMARIAVGQKVAVTPAGFSAPVEGKVRLIAAQLDKTTRLGRVKVALDPDPRLRPGTYARGQVELTRRDGLTVPLSAVMFDATGAYVLTVTDGTVAERRVEPGLKSQGRVEILKGLSPDDSVVVRAGGFLRDGDKVNPVAAPLNTSETRTGVR
ncbi:efflux RND transporter periplasmic adaptor subunit [Aquabacter spiritensis]|uniref:RND family efflux transporter MFP subunit n=1 Tax=Aquabacter spiritensis TaxID=933073 RepID=A0A4V2UXX3_9HYPH|nr:efflux RND transporter periplasmic adaptor subunit [Aquabacter spiritensis]TCT05168.1 RND family efflux transporter MFP subunit [Aquabacter spiritensis]